MKKSDQLICELQQKKARQSDPSPTLSPMQIMFMQECMLEYGQQIISEIQRRVWDGEENVNDILTNMKFSLK